VMVTFTHCIAPLLAPVGKTTSIDTDT
jgi:hypothetical protein